MAADAYQEWCRDAMLPRYLGYGEMRQTWFRSSVDGWDCTEPEQWLPRRREAQLAVPKLLDRSRIVWVPDERAWLGWLTTAGYSISIGARTHEDRYPVGLVQPRGPVIRAVNAISWAHGMALCWAQTPDGLKHFRLLEVPDA
jgi:hypothetical protein